MDNNYGKKDYSWIFWVLLGVCFMIGVTDASAADSGRGRDFGDDSGGSSLLGVFVYGGLYLIVYLWWKWEDDWRHRGKDDE